MAVLNSDIARGLVKLADLIELEGGYPFRIRAYPNAARIVGELPRNVLAMTAAGEDLAETIETLAEAGHITVLANELSVKLVASADAHRVAELGLMRLAVDGATHVGLFGEEIAVRGKTRTTDGFSAHAGQRELTDWHTRIAGADRTFPVHGEMPAKEALARYLSGPLVERPALHQKNSL